MNTIPITTARMAAVATLIGGILLGGCETASPRRDPVRTNTAAEDARIDHRPAGITAEPVASTVIDARPAAIVNGRTVTWGELRPALNELAGAAALQEHILDRELAGLLAGAGLVIGEADTSRERRRMLDALDADPETAIRLLRELRDRDGLGDARFASLLYRNAALRALVAPEVRVTEDAVQEMFEVLHGAKRQVRVMVVPTFAVAERMLQRLQAGESFADLAVAHSTDSSAPRGGLLEPISR
ncbi:MAG: hypothetical protein KDA25_06430, partial [Phycisphaerales bacterium]|nr:hypothetical protein [Phycisphaerales bacterium]